MRTGDASQGHYFFRCAPVDVMGTEQKPLEKEPAFRATIVPEPEWDALFHGLMECRGKAMIIGATDSGKSTLVRYLLERMIAAEVKVCLVDSDVGQSSLGLPGTISMKLFRYEQDMGDFRYDQMSFIGTVNPARDIASVINTTKRMSGKCRTMADVTLLDTSGLISGDIGMALKVGKINAIKPDHIIAIQGHDELEHILNSLDGIKVHRIATPSSAQIRTIAMRTRYRNKRLGNYFRQNDISDFILYAKEVHFLHRGLPIALKGHAFKKNTVIGLNHGEDTLALGILCDITDDSIMFRTPLSSLRKINRVVFGDMTMDLFESQA
jgi:polynucleotide 5'-hydroxyl-kinase GRC3/NOL9